MESASYWVEVTAFGLTEDEVLDTSWVRLCRSHLEQVVVRLKLRLLLYDIGDSLLAVPCVVHRKYTLALRVLTFASSRWTHKELNLL